MLSVLLATVSARCVSVREGSDLGLEHEDAGCSRGDDRAGGSHPSRRGVGWHGAPAAAALAARQLQCAALCDFAVGHSTGVSAAAAGQRVLVGAGC